MWSPRLPKILNFARKPSRTESGRRFDALLQEALFAHLAHDADTTERALTDAVRIDSDSTLFHYPSILMISGSPRWGIGTLYPSSEDRAD